MDSPLTIHAGLAAYCRRNGIAMSSFGSFVVGDSGFADRLRRGTAPIGKVLSTQRFMAEHPDVPRREFGAIAKAWRQRIEREGGGDAGGDGAGHDGAPAAVANGNGTCTAATLEQVEITHNQEFQTRERT